MFTGIIETLGQIKNLEKTGGNLLLTISSEISKALKEDQSVAHNGVCLTVIHVNENTFQVEAVEETLRKSNLGTLEVGDTLNLERALTLEQRLDGHLVQGHVDAVGVCVAREEQSGSTLFTFKFPKDFGDLVIEKGSIAINGISLTAFGVEEDTFSVTIIPYTLEHTTMANIQIGDTVNLEFDIIGKYILRSQALKK